ncbi:DnaT-like ssDNA-binding protein [Sulfitobacter sp.]|uniref:DnaT-like ssDNA-binding protein n=1 Tax=Sulfitobacter sp. TaxID=1903071 RepID=UPI0032998E51
MKKLKWDHTLPAKVKAAMQKASEEELETSLKQATKFLETLPWKGEKLSPLQALAWPRKGVFRKDGTPVEGVPTEVKHACYEVAGFILADIPMSATSMAYVFYVAGDLIEDLRPEHIPKGVTWH